MTSNFAVSTVATAPSPATSGTSVTVATGHGSRFSLGLAVICPAGAEPTPSTAEVVEVTAIVGDVLTIVRARESSTARAVITGDNIRQGITAGMWDEGILSDQIWGDGSDGDVTISTSVTLSRDMYYNTLTLASGSNLNPNGFRIFCRRSFTVAAGGLISANGNNAGGSVPGSPRCSTNTLLVGQQGKAGTTTNGGAGTTHSNSLGGSSGAGGAGTGGTGGAVGAATLPTAQAGSPRHAGFAGPLGSVMGASGGTIIWIQGGAGGGGGGGNGTRNGGGGGGGGSVIVIGARSVVNNGTISSNGGNGSIGDAAGCGGGGGGGGGVVIICCSTFTGTAASVAGGSGGAANGAGAAGNAGSAGNVLLIQGV